MSEPAVCDASALVALLTDDAEDGRWAAAQLADCMLSAPALVMFETANILRRHSTAGLVSEDQAAQAHADLLDLSIDLWPYELLAARVWELRSNLSAYDASYVAVAEFVAGPLVTLDRKISRAPGPRCSIRTR